MFARIKTIRNDWVDRLYSRRPAAGHDALAVLRQRYAGRRLAITVAFNNAWTIRHLAPLWRKYQPDRDLLVFDNSDNSNRAREIAEICGREKTPYIKLPRNPEWNASRSHGISLNWIFRNFVRPTAPRDFVFIDHDLFPVRQLDLSGILDSQPFYGFERHLDGGWYLWAGYSGFRFADIADVPLNFNSDAARGLDTGGRNWAVYFQTAPTMARQASRSTWEEIVHIRDGEAATFNVFDSALIHAGGASYRSGQSAEKSQAYLTGVLESALADCLDQDYAFKFLGERSGIKTSGSSPATPPLGATQ